MKFVEDLVRNIIFWFFLECRYGGLSFGYPRIFNSLNFLDLVELFNLKSFVKVAMDFGIGDGGPGPNEETTDDRPMLNGKQIARILMTACSKSIGDKVRFFLNFKTKKIAKHLQRHTRKW